MANPHKSIPDSISPLTEHEGVDKPMNDQLGTEGAKPHASDVLGEQPSTQNYDSATEALDNMASIDSDSLLNDDAGTNQDGITEGLTPMHRQNIDESRIDEVLVEDNLDDSDYPTIRDIADNDAVALSHEDDL